MSSDATAEPFNPDDHLLIPVDRVDDVLNAVRESADSAPDEAFRAGKVEGAEHYDRLLREYAE